MWNLIAYPEPRCFLHYQRAVSTSEQLRSQIKMREAEHLSLALRDTHFATSLHGDDPILLRQADRDQRPPDIMQQPRHERPFRMFGGNAL